MYLQKVKNKNGYNLYMGDRNFMNFKISENLKTKKETYYVNNKKVSVCFYFSKIRECMMNNLSYNSSVVFSTKRTRYFLSSYN